MSHSSIVLVSCLLPRAIFILACCEGLNPIDGSGKNVDCHKQIAEITDGIYKVTASPDALQAVKLSRELNFQEVRQLEN